MNSVTEMSSIRMQIMWNRLISVVEEQAQTLIRTAFSTSVREAGDLAAAVFDNQGRMLAHGPMSRVIADAGAQDVNTAFMRLTGTATLTGKPPT